MIYKAERNYITFPGGAQFVVETYGLGACQNGQCYPEFLTPTVTQTTATHGKSSRWEQTVNNRVSLSSGCAFLSYNSFYAPSDEPYTCCDAGYILTATQNGNQCVANTGGGGGGSECFGGDLCNGFSSIQKIC